MLGEPIDEHVAQDDAGSGRDAGAALDSAVVVERGVDHTAGLFPQGRGLVPTEDFDWFTFTGAAGEAVTVSRVWTDQVDRWALNCIRVLDADGTQVGDTSCGDSITVTLPSDGTYVAELGYYTPMPGSYTFRIS